MDELELLKKRVDELERLVKSLLNEDGRDVHLSGIPVGNLVLGKGCHVAMNSCPTGMAFFAEPDDVEKTESRLVSLTEQAEELESMLDDLEDRIDDLSDHLHEAE